MNTRLAAFSSRNIKELVRDPLMSVFCAGLPAVLLLLFAAIQKNAPLPLFVPANSAPGLAVFSLSFLSLFAGMLIAKDRDTAFLSRLFAAPLTASEFLLGYILPLFPLAAAQSTVCFLVALPLGLPFGPNLLAALAVLLPAALFYIAFGLLLGTLCSDKAVGAVASLFVNVAAWLGNTWFDVSLVGGAFETAAHVLPFSHAVAAARAAVAGDWAALPAHLAWVTAWAAVTLAAAVALFGRRLRGR